MKEIVIDPLWLITGLIAVIGAAVGFYIVRLDNMVEDLRKEIIKIEKDIGKLQNADVTCTTDMTIVKQDMTHIRSTMLKMVSHRFMRKSLRAEWKAAKHERRAERDHTHAVQAGDYSGE